MPIYAVSSEMKILFRNRALCDLTGQDDESLTSLTCVYQTPTESNPSRCLATGLCPPPDCFAGSPSEGWVSIPQGDQPHWRRASFIPSCPEAPGESNLEAGVLVFVHGDPESNPESNPGSNPGSKGVPEETPDPRKLHAAISRMQYEFASSGSIDLMAGISAASRRIRQQIPLAGQSGANVTIVGPPGSGRQNLVPLIHFARGPEHVGPLIPIDCRLSDPELIQETIKSLYRSHRQDPDQPLGRIFLRDLDQLSAAAQRELIGFLELPDFPLPMIATAAAGRAAVLPPLWENLSTLTIEIPPLTERRQDIPYLIQAIVEQFNDGHHRQLAGLDSATMGQLVRYSWPGELSEMIEAIDAACRSATASQIRFEDLPTRLRIALRAEQDLPPMAETGIQLDDFLSEIEDELIRRAVAYTDGNKSEAARLLHISRPRLLRRLGTAETPDFMESDEAPSPPDPHPTRRPDE